MNIEWYHKRQKIANRTQVRVRNGVALAVGGVCWSEQGNVYARDIVLLVQNSYDRTTRAAWQIFSGDSGLI